MSENHTSDQIDPEIAELMGISPENSDTQPDFAKLFDEGKAAEKADQEEVDLSRKSFEAIIKIEEDPKPFFRDKDYYKRLLLGEGEIARRVHSLLSQLMASKDPKDRSMHRARLIPAFWELLSGIAARIGDKLSKGKILALRFGILAPNLLSKEQRDMISRIIFDNNTGEPVHYMDEWIKKIATGATSPSATDEVKRAKQDDNQKLIGTIEKRKGKRQAEFSLLQNKIAQLDQHETNLAYHVKCILKHQTRADMGGLKDSYTVEQRESFSQIASILKTLSTLDRDIKASYAQLSGMDSELNELAEKAEGADVSSLVDRSMVIGEFNSVRQMAKLCVGRQGNHFPILMKQYIRSNIRDIATRENVINIMAYVESLDQGVFLRTFKGETNRIVPHVLLHPNYGETGICWEPFERYNRASSRGRVVIPLYPKDINHAVISALADLRWQVAKEKAQHYWMEEGITGRYYMWFSDKKLRGDVREFFIRDYILWITKESQGTQKLDREVRGIFWRNMPFPQVIKDNLGKRGFVYKELYKKDSNISMSDGY